MLKFQKFINPGQNTASILAAATNHGHSLSAHVQLTDGSTNVGFGFHATNEAERRAALKQIAIFQDAFDALAVAFEDAEITKRK